ncbi:MAG: pyridoxine 5'-phosphate synthase, partial [Gammaproteobacteria bacterium]|nr:pyridoxine 5'-phosphate synthase [Gammaproteobacteria bacterium]
GLDVCSRGESLTGFCSELSRAGIEVSLFIDPETAQVEAAAAVGVPVVELHTGSYADAQNRDLRSLEFGKIAAAAGVAAGANLQVNAGHGLTYDNVAPIVAIPELVELNIGHAIVARALFSGLGAAVAEMKRIVEEASR